MGTMVSDFLVAGLINRLNMVMVFCVCRLEQEQRRQQELHKQLEKQRQIEREREEQRQKMLEQREVRAAAAVLCRKTMRWIII